MTRACIALEFMRLAQAREFSIDFLDIGWTGILIFQAEQSQHSRPIAPISANPDYWWEMLSSSVLAARGAIRVSNA